MELVLSDTLRRLSRTRHTGEIRALERAVTTIQRELAYDVRPEKRR